MDTKSFLKLLVETESPSHDKAAVDRVGTLIAAEAQKLGAQVEFVRNEKTGDHVVARWQGTGKPILLVCHMDTVFPMGTINSFPYREAEGKIHGPGVSDMKASIAISLGAIEEAQRNLEKAQTNLDGTKIFAPTDGTIISVNIATGDEAGTSTAIVMANLDKPYVDIYMDESDWDKAVVGNPVEVTFNSLPDSAFTGTINSVDRELYTSGGNTSVHTTALLDSTIDEINLPIGASASVEVTGTHAQNAILVPLEALQESDAGGYTVYVETADGVAPRSVTIGIQTELYAEIKSGLDEGEVVVTNPTEIQ